MSSLEGETRIFLATLTKTGKKKATSVVLLVKPDRPATGVNRRKYEVPGLGLPIKRPLRYSIT